MMMEILRLIDKGGMSLRDMSKELAIDRTQLENRIGSLVNSGYIKELRFIAECSSSKCKDCPMGSSCKGDEELIPRVLELTEKGKRSIS